MRNNDKEYAARIDLACENQQHVLQVERELCSIERHFDVEYSECIIEEDLFNAKEMKGFRSCQNRFLTSKRRQDRFAAGHRGRGA